MSATCSVRDRCGPTGKECRIDDRVAVVPDERVPDTIQVGDDEEHRKQREPARADPRGRVDYR